MRLAANVAQAAEPAFAVEATETPRAAHGDAALLRLKLARREGEVLRWVTAGKTRRNITSQLACSPRTVHQHLQRVYTNLGVDTRTVAAMRELGCG